jgi:SnoaL-like protein
MSRLWLAMGFGVVFVVFGALIAPLARPQPSADPLQVIIEYETARNQYDLQTALSYFADDATVTQRSATYSGKDDIRKFLDNTAARSRFMSVSDRRVLGDEVTWTERLYGQGQGPWSDSQGRAQGYLAGGFGGAGRIAVNVEATVQDGKIRSLSYTFAGVAAPSETTVEPLPEIPAGFGLVAVISVIAGLLVVASVAWSRRLPGTSTQRGHLIQNLHSWAAARQ